MHELYLRYKSVSVFGSTAAEITPLAELVAATDMPSRVKTAAAVFRAVADSGCDSTGEWIKKLVISDDNPFSRAVAMGERISPKIKAQVMNELTTFKQLSMLRPCEFAGETSEFFPQFGFGGFSVTYDGLVKTYAQNGCGLFGEAATFVYRDGEFLQALSRNERLSDLKGYAEEKYEIESNTHSFAEGRPAFHTLLIGERGTGKSATVRAVAHEQSGKVKLIEVDISELTELVKKIRGLKQKFIIFIDALDMRDWEKARAAADRVLDAPISNYIIYCTVDRDKGSGEASDSELALFDRFGLVVTYLSPDKEEFSDILKQILRARSIKWRDEYGSVAELAARKKGGRSPRAAKQIADLIECTYAQKRCD